MELYLDPVATTSRAVLALCEHEQIPITVRHVKLMEGEHHRPPLSDLNPNRLVPVLVDEDFVLTEASAILRYLSRKTASPLYPTDMREQARVDELLAWFESNLYRDFGFQYVYPQLMPHHRRATEEANRDAIEWGREQSTRWLEVLESHFLGHDGPYLLGSELTIADFFAASILSLGDLVGCRFRDYPNIMRWRESMDALPSWHRTNRPFRELVESLPERSVVALDRAERTLALQ
jgi:glutathione S-transferase